MVNNKISCDTGQGKTDWHVWWSTISVQTLDRVRKNDGSQYGELQLYNFRHWKR